MVYITARINVHYEGPPDGRQMYCTIDTSTSIPTASIKSIPHTAVEYGNGEAQAHSASLFGLSFIATLVICIKLNPPISVYYSAQFYNATHC